MKRKILELNDGQLLIVSVRKDTRGPKSGELWVDLQFIKIFYDGQEPKIKLVSLRLDEFREVQQISMSSLLPVEEKQNA